MIDGIAANSSFEYNWDGKLRSAQSGVKDIDLKYDLLGNRIWKDSSVNGRRKYIVDIVGELPVILMELEMLTIITVSKKAIFTLIARLSPSTMAIWTQPNTTICTTGSAASG